MATESFVGWIDMSPDDLNRARDYLRRLEEGTVDELGFGIIRDYISEEFFPATSTVMTTARQYVLVPFCCLYLERRILAEKWDIQRARRELYDMENDLRKSVSFHRKGDTLRMPSTIFWPALRKLRIFCDESSIHSYLRKLCEASGRRYRNDDKGVPAVADEMITWDPELIHLYEKEKDGLIEEGRFRFDDPAKKKINARITSAEAKYLRGVYARNAKQKPSIMSHLLQGGIEPAHSFPWDLKYPTELRALVEDARRFSLLVQGARIIYYQLLIEERKNLGLPKLEAPDYGEYFSAWWKIAHIWMREWDLGAFFGRVRPAVRPERKDHQFLTDFLNQVVSVSLAKDFFHSIAVRKMVREREERVRPYKSRLRKQKYLEQWNPVSYDIANPNSAYGLYFRGDKASQLCREIISGLNRGKSRG